MLRSLFAPLGAALFLALSSSFAVANSDGSFSVAEQILGELTLINEANGTLAGSDPKAPELAERQPRHNIQKAREVWLKVEELRGINGLAQHDVPEFPMQEVQSSDVAAFLDLILADVRDLRPVFGVVGQPITPSAGASATPTDVYAHLSAISLQLDGLGIPKISGNEVFQVVETLIHDLEVVAEARGVSPMPEEYSGAEGMKPKDVYARVFEVSDQLAALAAQQPEMNVPGGIVQLNRRSGKISPAHVLDLLNNVLADANAVKAAAGVMKPSELVSGGGHGTHVNPNTVHDGVTTALLIAQSIS